jgi:uncharacterized protein (DUF362 family)
VGNVYEEFQSELEGWRRKYAGRPEREIRRLFLLALEREEIVSIAYSEDVILRRLARTQLDAEIRDLIHHALVWAWKDEQMHAIYVRGALMKSSNARLRALAFLRQMSGIVGGWAASVRQHVPFRDAPLSRSLATFIAWAGYLMGQVPKDVWPHLDYRPFRDYCLYNVDAERTAWLCFKRVIELARNHAETAAMEEDFRRAQEDEDRHSRIFEIIAHALDENDQLMADETADSLAEKIGEVGEVFLPRSRRHNLAAENPLGSGGRVFVLRGETKEEKIPLLNRLLDEAGLKTLIEERARETNRRISDIRVAIKPTFMLGYHRKDLSTITDTELLTELAVYLRRLGCADVAVVEARNIYDQFYKNRAVADVARYFHISSPHFRLVDSSEEQVQHQYERGLAQYTVGRTWKEADFRITFGKMRSHPVEMVYLTIGNLEGLGDRCDKFFFVERQAQRETALMMLIDEFPPHFALIDAYDSAADGLMGMMGCPRPRSPRRLYGGADALAVDMVAARQMGMSDPRDSSLIRAAGHWFGNPRNIEVVGCDEALRDWRGPYHNEWSTLLSLFAYPVYEFASSRGAVFVPEMDEEAFPTVEKEGRILRLRRRSLQAFLGLRHRK